SQDELTRHLPEVRSHLPEKGEHEVVLRTVVNDDEVSSKKEPVCDGGLDVADPADQHAQRHELTSPRRVSFGSRRWWPVVALVLVCPWAEHHEARQEEQQSDEHDAPSPHGQ